MVLLSAPDLPSDYWRVRSLPRVAQIITIVAAAPSVLVSLFGLANGRDLGFGSRPLDLLLLALEIALVLVVVFRPSLAWIPLLALQGVLVGTNTDSGTYAVHFLVVVSIMAFAAGRWSLAAAWIGTIVWTIWTSTIVDLRVDTFITGYLAMVLVATLVGLSLRLLAARRESDAEKIASFETDLRGALREQRDSLARELHDIVAHDLTIIAMQASSGALQAPTDPSREAFTVIGDSSRRALNDLRLLLRVLRTDTGPRPDRAEATTNIDLVGELAELADQLQTLGHDVTTHVRGALETVPTPVLSSGGRLLREGVTNVVKHGASHSTVDLSVLVDHTHAEFVVKSAPRPVRAPAQRGFRASGFGLLGLEERISLLSGEFHAGADGDGWTVRARIPLRADQTAPAR